MAIDSARTDSLKILNEWTSSPQRLKPLIDKHLKVVELDRRAKVTDLCYGTIRNKLCLEKILNSVTAGKFKKNSQMIRNLLLVAGYETRFTRTPLHAVTNEYVEIAKVRFGKQVAGFVNAVIRSCSQFDVTQLTLAQQNSLPSWIFREIKQYFDGDALEKAAAGFAARPGIWLRVNSQKTTAPEVVQGLEALGASVEEVRGNALLVKNVGAVHRHKAFQEGHWSVQDFGSQTVGNFALKFGKDSHVLDACAGNGGKTFQLLEAGVDAVTALDNSETQLKLLSETALRLGTRPSEMVCSDLQNYETAVPYDVVLIDAPCSGLGVIRRQPEKKWNEGSELIESMASLQKSLLAAAAQLSPPHIVYSVCSFTGRETGEVVDWFLEGYPRYSLVETSRTWPHVDNADAFFVARFTADNS